MARTWRCGDLVAKASFHHLSLRRGGDRCPCHQPPYAQLANVAPHAGSLRGRIPHNLRYLNVNARLKPHGGLASKALPSCRQVRPVRAAVPSGSNCPRFADVGPFTVELCMSHLPFGRWDVQTSRPRGPARTEACTEGFVDAAPLTPVHRSTMLRNANSRRCALMAAGRTTRGDLPVTSRQIAETVAPRSDELLSRRSWPPSPAATKWAESSSTLTRRRAAAAARRHGQLIGI